MVKYLDFGLRNDLKWNIQRSRTLEFWSIKESFLNTKKNKKELKIKMWNRKKKNTHQNKQKKKKHHISYLAHFCTEVKGEFSGSSTENENEIRYWFCNL